MHTSYSDWLARKLWKAVYKIGDSVDGVQSLLDEGADPNHELYWSEEWMSKKWLPPLHAACERGKLKKVKVLIERRANTDKADSIFNLTPLQRAFLEGRKQVVEYLTKEVKCKLGKNLVNNLQKEHVHIRYILGFVLHTSLTYMHGSYAMQELFCLIIIC